MKSINFLLFTVLISSNLFISCGRGGEGAAVKTIAELLSENPNLSSFSAAIESSDLIDILSGNSKITVFAPTNVAFDNFLSENGFTVIEEAPASFLKLTLLNHIVSREVLSQGLSSTYLTNLSTNPVGDTLSMFMSRNGGLSLNGVSNVSTFDISAKNGIVHIVDAVIELRTIITFLSADPTFSTLVSALSRENLGRNYVDLLSVSGPFTFFAPTNSAFQDLFSELNVSGLEDINDSDLNSIIQYHLVDGNVRASALLDGQIVTTYGDSKFTIDLSEGDKIIDNQDRTTDITNTNVQAFIGVVHVLDRVLLP